MSQDLNVTFDTLSYVKTLEKAGFARDQAEALATANFRIFAELITHTLATKTDIKALDVTMKTEIKRLDAKIESLHTELKKDIEILRSDLARDISNVKVDVLRWVVPMLIGQTAVLAALVKLL